MQIFDRIYYYPKVRFIPDIYHAMFYPIDPHSIALLQMCKMSPMGKRCFPYYPHAVLIPSILLQIFALLPVCKQPVLNALSLWQSYTLLSPCNKSNVISNFRIFQVASLHVANKTYYPHAKAIPYYPHRIFTLWPPIAWYPLSHFFPDRA